MPKSFLFVRSGIVSITGFVNIMIIINQFAQRGLGVGREIHIWKSVKRSLINCSHLNFLCHFKLSFNSHFALKCQINQTPVKYKHNCHNVLKHVISVFIQKLIFVSANFTNTTTTTDWNMPLLSLKKNEIFVS